MPKPKITTYFNTNGCPLNCCPECNVVPGNVHKENCGKEQCPTCGLMRQMCQCFFEDDDESLMSQYPPIPWNGLLPGVKECIDFGWFARWDDKKRGWVPCSSDYGGCIPDLNRLLKNCRWDRAQQRWVKSSLKFCKLT